jgi:hypothetical protein
MFNPGCCGALPLVDGVVELVEDPELVIVHP